MTDTIIVEPTVNEVVVQPQKNVVIIEPVGMQGPKGDAGSFPATFESTSKNLESHPYALNYTDDQLTSIVYDLGGGESITKTLNYTGDRLDSIALSGDTPDGISLTKTLVYTDEDLTGVTYS